MLPRLLAAALLSGALAGVLVTFLQTFTTTPLVLAAEAYEDVAAAAAWPADAALHLAHGEEGPVGEAFRSAGQGIERGLLTGLANVATGVAFAMLLAAAFLVRGRPVDGRAGLMWGIGGFAAFALAPALGLPPELPGAATAEIGARQAWWLLAAAATAAGLWLLLLARPPALKAAGAALVLLPHLAGAPPAPAAASALPAELASHFVSASLATGFVFWSLLGWLAGRFCGPVLQRWALP